MATQIFFISLVAGLFLIGAEIFVPGGILGVIGALLLIVSIVDAFIAFDHYGPYIALFIIIFVGVAFYLWIKIFPRTGVGRRMTVSNDMKTFKATETGLAELLGQEGIAASQLRPAGYVDIAGRRVDVVTGGELIDKGARVRVIEVEGNTVTVEVIVG